MTIFSIQDYGGIIPHVEHLAAGLREIGHSVDFVMLMHQPGRPKATRQPEEDGWFKLGTGYPFHPSKGWTELPRFGWQSADERRRFKDYCSNFDGVIWHIPVPTMNNATAGHDEWMDLYPSRIPNVAVIHDGNLPKLYPHILTVRDKFKRLVCVHDSAYNSSEGTGMTRERIYNPFDVAGWLGYEPKGFEGRKGVVAVQVFKAWKRVDTLIRAVPLMKNAGSVIVGGGGIEQRYMVSPDKCKPAYFNPDGSRIWDRAVESGMQYVGFIDNDAVYDYLLNARVQVDPSWSFRYAKFGSHFNRTTVEAMLAGTLPMATDLGMKDSSLFRADENFVEIKAGCEPAEFAERVDAAIRDRKQWERITKWNRVVLKEHFDRRAVAAKFVNALVEDAPFHGPASPEIIGASRDHMEFFTRGAA